MSCIYSNFTTVTAIEETRRQPMPAKTDLVYKAQ